MRKSFVSFAALATLLLVGPSLKAQPISWGYSATSTEIFSNNQPPFITPLSSIAFEGSTKGASGDSGIVIYNLRSFSTALESSPDSFSNVPFNLAITFTDLKATSDLSGTAKVSDTVKFSGLFSASNVSKSSLVTDAQSWTSPLSAELVLGGNDANDGWRKYTVTISPNLSFSPPGQPGGDPGSVSVTVKITPTDAPDGSGITPDPSPTPEPASLVLAGLGLPLLVLMRRRLKKTQSETTLA